MFRASRDVHGAVAFERGEQAADGGSGVPGRVEV
jgi:hypothetical protein